MVALNFNLAPENPTLRAVDKALELESEQSGKRYYLGASLIGDPCSRKLWYGFRKVLNPAFEAKTLRCFADGHTQEAEMARRLRLVPGIELWTTDPDRPGSNAQMGFALFGGHFKGHWDGVIRGILEAPKTVHIWEHKSTNETKFDKLTKMLTEQDEKTVLEQWDYIYYAQAVLYMHMSDLTRHFMTVSTPGGRDYISLRTNENPKLAKELIQKAGSIVFSDRAPPRAYNSPDFYLCKWCNFSSVCWGTDKKILKHCRTCAHVTIVESGLVKCEVDKAKHRTLMILDQEKGCSKQYINPTI